MNKKLFIFTSLVCSFILIFSACTNNDDNELDQEWIDYNTKLYNEVVQNSEYRALQSESKNGSVYFKYIDDFIEDYQSLKKPKITEEGTPYFTDSISMRYEGFYYKKDGTKYTFDTTEGGNNYVVYRTRVNSLIDGMSTMLQYMEIDEQVEVCIPYRLGYKEAGNSSIPGYTTLWFRMKLLNIYDDSKKEWVKK